MFNFVPLTTCIYQHTMYIGTFVQTAISDLRTCDNCENKFAVWQSTRSSSNRVQFGTIQQQTSEFNITVLMFLIQDVT